MRNVFNTDITERACSKHLRSLKKWQYVVLSYKKSYKLCLYGAEDAQSWLIVRLRLYNVRFCLREGGGGGYKLNYEVSLFRNKFYFNKL